jgi:hypothetical protein
MAWTYAYSIAKEEVNELVRKLGEDLKRIIADKVAPKRAITRQLRPEDIGLPNPSWEVTIPAGATEVTLYQFTVPQTKAVGIFGFYSDYDAIKEIEVYAGSKRVAVIPLEEMYYFSGRGDYVAKFLTGEDILKIPERTEVRIVGKVYPAPTSSATARLLLLGVIAEAEGDVVSL